MSTDTLSRIKERQGIWGKIQNFFTLGYGTKEDLREVDKALRDNYYQTFKEVRYKWIEINLAALEAGLKGDDFKKVLQVTDRLMEKVHRADYGYAGLFDRKGHIREEGLSKSLDFDKEFSVSLEEFESAVNEVFADYESEDWKSVTAKVKKIRSGIVALDTKWNDREQVFRPIGV
jgi:fido (protein-threonine AMPylation protein)